MKPAKFDHAVPFLPVRDLQETIKFYRDQLGFYKEWFWKDRDAGIERDNLHLLFNHDADFVSRINTEKQKFEIMWFVENVEAIYAEYKQRNLKIVKELKAEAWGTKEFAFEDINGYIFRIAEGREP